MKLAFTKMHGLGNDFVVIDATRAPLALSVAQLRHIADRRFGMLNLASFVLGFTAYASLFFLSLFFQQAQGLSAASAGSQLVPQFLLMAIHTSNLLMT